MQLFICLVCVASGWACQHATTHAHSELSTTVLIVRMVCQSSGKIKGREERGRGAGTGGVYAILSYLRFTNSSLLACLLFSVTEKKQSSSVK